jgi:hypothetical protein
MKSRVIVQIETSATGPSTQPAHKHNRQTNPAAPTN